MIAGRMAGNAGNLLIYDLYKSVKFCKTAKASAHTACIHLPAANAETPKKRRIFYYTMRCRKEKGRGRGFAVSAGGQNVICPVFAFERDSSPRGKHPAPRKPSRGGAYYRANAAQKSAPAESHGADRALSGGEGKEIGSVNVCPPVPARPWAAGRRRPARGAGPGTAPRRTRWKAGCSPGSRRW